MDTSSSYRRRAVVILPIVAILIALFVIFRGSREPDRFSEGSTIPDFVLMDHRSRLHDSAELGGKVVAIVFWKVSVESSVAELKGLDQLTQEYGSQGFETLGICLDEGGKKYLKGFVARHRVKIPLMIGNVETAHLFGGLRGVPTTFIFDRDGKVTDILEGFRGRDDIETRILELL